MTDKTAAAVSTDPGPVVEIDEREARRVVLSSVIGTTIEFYDFGLYGLASVLVFGPQFFPTSNPTVAQLGALATFAVGFFMRPVGGIVGGHFGDRIGRKRVMIWSFMIMGIATMLIAFLPTYATIGVAAPILLILLRLVQGFAAGAEWSGAALMAVEHAPPNKRGLYGSAPAFGNIGGSFLASAVLLIASAVNKDAFVSYGWRIAFGISFVLVIFGFYLRRRVSESPLFEVALTTEPPKVPLMTVLTKHPLSILRCMSWVLVSGATGYIVNTYGITFAMDSTKSSRDVVLLLLNVAYLVCIIAILVVGRLLDRWRRPVLIAVALVQVPCAVLLFPLLSIGSLATTALAFCLVFLGVGMIEATRGDVLTNLFPVEVRYTGVALSHNLAYVLAGMAPLASAAIVANTGSIAPMVGILAVIALIALPTAFVRRRTDEPVIPLAP